MKTVDEALAFAERVYSRVSDAGIIASEVRRLRDENERLRAVLESACEKMKQCRYVEARSDMLQAIDAARGAK